MDDQHYMQRCIDLARMGDGYVAPNPMVGAVLVYENRIIGEGFHKAYGGPHAEVNCLQSVNEKDKELIPVSTMYVSLEPCTHFGKTPPCADLLIRHQVKRIVVGCRDPFLEVNGKGIEKLESSGISVTTGVLEKECRELNKHFFTYHTEHRPYITLKWAQTANGMIANEDYSRLMISNAFTNRLVHQWRSKHMGILVGTNTALYDDPSLTTRLWPGKDAIRLVIDMHLRLPLHLKLFTSAPATIVFNLLKHTDMPEDFLAYPQHTGPFYYQVTEDVSLVHQVLNALYQLKIQSVLVEGGAQLLQSFIEEGCWDEAKIISNESLILQAGLPAPGLKDHQLVQSEKLDADIINTYVPQRMSRSI